MSFHRNLKSADQIAHEIESFVNPNYSAWTIGVTDDVNRRWAEHGCPQAFKYWNPTSEADSRAIESYFLRKGLKGGGGGPGKANYVYIF